MQLHAVADDPLDSSLDKPERDGAGRSDTSCDSSELSGSQEVRGFESLRLHRKSWSRECACVATPSGPARM